MNVLQQSIYDLHPPIHVTPELAGSPSRWYAEDRRDPTKGVWRARCVHPSYPGSYIDLAEIIDTSASYPELYEYNYHIHVASMPTNPEERNIRFDKDWSAARFGKLYHAQDTALGHPPGSPEDHQAFPPVCLRWALAIADVLIRQPTLPFADWLNLLPIALYCPDDYA